MSVNQMIILAIVILSSIIVVTIVYLAATVMINKKNKKKVDIFNPEELSENRNLIDVMEEKSVIKGLDSNQNDLEVKPKFMTEATIEPPVQLAKKDHIAGSFDPFAKSVENLAQKANDSKVEKNKFIQ